MDEIDANGQQHDSDSRLDLAGKGIEHNPPPQQTNPQEQPKQGSGKLQEAKIAMRDWLWAHYQSWKKEETHDKLNTLFTFAIATATIVYVIVASCQLGEMKRTTDLIRHQLASGIPAIVVPNISYEKPNQIQVSLTNSGKSVSKIATLELVVTRIDPSSNNPMGPSQLETYSRQQLLPEKPTSPTLIIIQGLDDSGLESIRKNRETIVIKGKNVFDNGFGDIVTVDNEEDTCWQLAANRSITDGKRIAVVGNLTTCRLARETIHSYQEEDKKSNDWQ
jgi:hypothetical protein